MLKYLIEVRQILGADENKYILNDLYITDYCVWLQKTKDKKILYLANKLQCVDVKKSEMGFDLKDIENEASSICDRIHVDTSSGSERDSSEDSIDSSTATEDDCDLVNENVDGKANCTANEQNLPVIESHKRMIEVLLSRNNDNVEILSTGLEELLKIEEYASGCKFTEQ